MILYIYRMPIHMHFSTPTPSTLSDVFLKYLAKTKTTTQRLGRISPNINRKSTTMERTRRKFLGCIIPDPLKKRVLPRVLRVLRVQAGAKSVLELHLKVARDGSDRLLNPGVLFFSRIYIYMVFSYIFKWLLFPLSC